MSTFAISQLLVGFVFITDLLAFQFKDRRVLLCLLAISSILLSGHYFLLEEWNSGSLMLLSTSRFLISIFSTDRRWMFFYLTVGLLVFGWHFEHFHDGFPLIAMVFATVGSFQQEDRLLRRLMMASTLFWILNNLVVGSPAGVALESAFLSGNLIGYWRFYLKPARHARAEAIG